MYDYIKYTILPFCKKYYIAITIILIIFIISFSFITEKIQTQRAYYEQKLTVSSDIEKLEKIAKEAVKQSNISIWKIKTLENKIKQENQIYEKNLLISRCIEQQINRKIKWKEYSIDYCNDSVNLEQFRSKKL